MFMIEEKFDCLWSFEEESRVTNGWHRGYHQQVGEVVVRRAGDGGFLFLLALGERWILAFKSCVLTLGPVMLAGAMNTKQFGRACSTGLLFQ
jgi:hypothetical protein